MSGGEAPIAIVILAAGASRRMGVAKQLLQVRGRSLLRHAVDAALGSGCHPVVLVLGANAAAVRPEVEGLPVQVVQNPRWSKGLSTSIRAGIGALASGADPPGAAVLSLCDQPLVDSDRLRALVAAYRATGRPIVASEYQGALGAPALFARALFPELLGLEGDRGAGQVIQRHLSEVCPVPCPPGAVDLDTPRDVEALRSTESAAGRRPADEDS